MEKDITPKRYSAEELGRLRAEGRSRTDPARLQAQTDAGSERAFVHDADWKDVPEDWYRAAEAMMPVPKQLLSLRLDGDVLAWFREQGPGYQTRINAVLRTFVMQQRRSAP